MWESAIRVDDFAPEVQLTLPIRDRIAVPTGIGALKHVNGKKNCQHKRQIVKPSNYRNLQTQEERMGQKDYHQIQDKVKLEFTLLLQV